MNKYGFYYLNVSHKLNKLMKKKCSLSLDFCNNTHCFCNINYAVKMACNRGI